MTVVAWCKANEISPYTYYFRLKMVWKELLKRAETPLQQIVPLSISPNVLGSSAQISVQTPCIESACVESETLESSEVATMQAMIVRKNWDRFTIKDEHTKKDNFLMIKSLP